MPADEATSPESAAITAAMPVASTSAQLQERMDRERRARAFQLQQDYVDAQRNIAELSVYLKALLRP